MGVGPAKCILQIKKAVPAEFTKYAVRPREILDADAEESGQ